MPTLFPIWSRMYSAKRCSMASCLPGMPSRLTQPARHPATVHEPPEQPAHRVRVDGFFVDTCELTNVQFQAFVDATGYVTTAEKVPDLREIMKQLPPGTPPPPKEKLVAASLVFLALLGALHEVDGGYAWKFDRMIFESYRSLRANLSAT